AIGNQEIYNGYLLWARDHYDLRWNGRSLPVSWLLSVDAFISVGTTVLSVGFWSWLERRGRPVSELPKIAIGAVLCAAAVGVLAAAPAGRVGLGWGLGFHVLNDLGFTNTYYVALALYSRLAPPALGSTVVNSCVLQIFLANLLVSRLAGLLGTMDPSRFWGLHAAIIGAAALGLVLAAVAERLLRERSRRRAFAP
ncbi:MAG: MFS transporter, partial [Gluconacetobacter diazotrophicus]|nr:MFS transporter [Gluconacetobacter diazotrophicus]